MYSRASKASSAKPGGDIEDVLDEIAADNQLAESKGVELNPDRASEPEAE